MSGKAVTYDARDPLCDVVDGYMKGSSMNDMKMKTKPKRWKKGRDAESGQYVSDEYAEANPKTTVMETVEAKSDDLPCDTEPN